MGSKCKSSRAYDLMMRFIFISLFAICVCIEKQTVLASDTTSSGKSEKFVGHKHARRKLDDIGGDISIDCGIPSGFMYLDEKTQLSYKSDEEFIGTGVNKNISSKFMSANLQNTYATVRSFPEGNRNCYSLRPPEGKAKTYLTRASFMYGDYDDEDKLPEFDLYIGVNRWDSIKFDNASHVVIKEIIHSALMDEINICLLNTGKGTPFISALELRHFHNATYRTQSGALVLYRRLDVGSTTNQIIRFKDDHYDRIWVPYPGFPGSASINTSFIIDSLVDSQYRLPSAVMKTAVKPMNVNDSLEFDFEIGDPTLQFYVYMHFAELESLRGNQHREFSIKLNGNLWESVVPEYLQSKTISSTQPARGSKLNFSLCKTSNSTLPPILNAIEIYILTDTLQEPTDQDDVNAIMDIKLSYDVGKGWQGDPCSPINYSWDGLNCSYNGYKPPKIISLNLTSEGLTGKISPSLSNLKSLENLDLSNNSLTGSIPEFLSQLPLLRVLNLDGNKLSGSVPTSLMARSQNGSLLLSFGRNPDLCLSAPCKKEKRNIVMPVVAASVSLLVILIALLIFWTYKRKRAARLNVDNSHSKKEGSLKSDNQQFTYSEIVDITKNFHRILGKGGFGTVYHGYLADGSEVAVKMLSASSSQGPKQFRTEAQLLMRVHHRNLASLVGYCNDGEKVGLVYEYMAYGNLKQYLFDETKEALSWKDRVQIAVDAAQGLEYLHHGCKPPIIHRDVKTANILLNEKMQAKLADFGFSKIFPAESESHMSTSIVGTVGYLDPEYYASNRLTEKSDVYSFGIVLLELITGLPAIIRGYNNTHIVNRVCPFLERGMSEASLILDWKQILTLIPSGKLLRLQWNVCHQFPSKDQL